MASARPVIASNAGAPPEIVNPGVNGMLFARDDSISLRFAINELLGNPDKARRMGKAARSAYESLYHPDIHGGKLLQLFDRVLAK
jgi:glycosyltransferase involved in cell wall biosynthesis